MGPRIAAHFANAGTAEHFAGYVPPNLPADARRREAQHKSARWIGSGEKAKDGPAFLPSRSRKKFADWELQEDMERHARNADWIIEVVAEN